MSASAPTRPLPRAAQRAAPLPLSADVLATDGSFAGLLCAYGHAHRAGRLPAAVETRGVARDGHLFGAPVPVETEAALAGRVERGLERVRPGLVGRLFRAFLSERPGIETAILRLIDAVAVDGAAAAEDWAFAPTREVARWAQRVGREAHRMEAFVRFERHHAAELPADELPGLGGAELGEAGRERWVARVRPEVHVLPLLTEHFASRYPALRWAIVDDARGLALVHDTPAAERAPDAAPTRIVPVSSLPALAPAADEEAYQRMWRAYFRAVDIPERRNLRLHLRHVPKRYWPLLTEKQDDGR